MTDPTLAAPDWQVHAVRYATYPTTRSAELLRFAEYGEPDGPMICDFYLWVVRSAEQVILFDTGYTRAAGDRLGVAWLSGVPEALADLDLGPDDVTTVVHSHLHSDHVGNHELLSGAQVRMRREEWEFWTSPMAERALFRRFTDADQMAALERVRREGRLVLDEEEVEVAPGVRTVALPGHTPGSQGLLIESGGRRVLLASDAAHYYEELDDDRPFFIVDDLPRMYASFDRLRTAREDGVRVVAGHDPADLEAFERTRLRHGADLLRIL
ncbi:N-acyl homoserine lactonase family protein [Nocardioides fonticola]|uniref:N-acyl homoserine lactonase family protein n=1 Tax=Nocardioides fonticola TaxID=450363 RepID=A0ABP7XED4_9ACTN